MNYKDNKINEIPIIDIEIYPLLSVDKEASKILDYLISKKMLLSRKVRYFIISSDKVDKSTEYLNEYIYNNRKFVKINSKNDKDIFY